MTNDLSNGGNVKNAAAGQSLAIKAQSLYLLNLLLLPVVAFVILAFLWHRHASRPETPALARIHLQQAFYISIISGILIILPCLAFYLAYGFKDWHTWFWIIIYISCILSVLTIYGIIALARAMSGQPYVYPLLGRFSSRDS